MQKGDLTIAYKALALGTESPLARRVGTALLDHYNRNTGRCDPSIDTLATLLSVHRRSVIRAIGQLVGGGYFRRDRHGGHFNCNHYTPIWSRFRAVDEAWQHQRRMHSARFGERKMSPDQCALSHHSSDSLVTQTYPSNSSYVTSSGAVKTSIAYSKAPPKSPATTTLELIQKSAQAYARQSHVKSAYRDVARDAAERRLSQDVGRAFTGHPQYFQVIEVFHELEKAAVDCELNRQGEGIKFVASELRQRGIALDLTTVWNGEAR